MEGIEWAIVLGIGVVLLWLVPTKFPAMMKALGRARGEFRKGQTEVEQETQVKPPES